MRLMAFRMCHSRVPFAGSTRHVDVHISANIFKYKAKCPLQCVRPFKASLVRIWSSSLPMPTHDSAWNKYKACSARFLRLDSVCAQMQFRDCSVAQKSQLSLPCQARFAPAIFCLHLSTECKTYVAQPSTVSKSSGHDGVLFICWS